MGWRAVSAAGFQGRGSQKRNVLVSDTGSMQFVLRHVYAKWMAINVLQLGW